MKSIRKLRKHLPSKSQIEEYRYFNRLGKHLVRDDVWSFGRSSTAKGIAIGIFCAFLPMPFEMIPAIMIAIAIGGNIPFSVAGVWISNPLTWIPLYTPCYLLGSKILQLEPIPIEQISLLSLGSHYMALWLGCLIVGFVLAMIIHFSIDFIWAMQIRRRWAERKKKRKENLR